MKDKTIRVEIEGDYRVIVISDIHAHLEALKTLLERADLKETDYLVILGDFVNRGPDSYATYQYIRQLAERPRTFVLKGNHESFMQRPIEENLYFDEIVGFLQTDPYATLLHECADAVGMPLNRCEPQFLRREIIKQYGDMLTFLRELPILLYFDEFLFVHGGYDEDFNLEDETDYLRFDFFSDIGKKQDRVTIVGHSPACNYRDTYLSNAPFFNLDKNIITIDGGCGIKPTGELNAFIVEKQLGEITYDWLQYNDFEEATVLQTFEFHEEDPIHLRWPETAFKIIEWGRVMTLCEHNKTGKRFRVFNNLLTIDKGEHIIKRDYANTFFNLPIGTKVELCQLFEDCALVKYDGVFGWLRREQICPHVIM